MKISALLLLYSLALLINNPSADEVKVRYLEGLSRGFMVLRTTDGKQIAHGESNQVNREGKITNHLVFRFDDGSVYDNTTVFTQNSTFRLLTDRVIQKGPAFKTPLESSIDATSGEVTVRYNDKGKKKILNKKLNLPPGIANGLIFTLVKNIPPNAAATLPYVAITPEPRLVTLVIAAVGQDTLYTGGSPHKALHFVMKVKIGGIAGAIVPAIGKQPPDTQIWIIPGEAPTFAASEGPLYGDGPVWRINLVSPERAKPQKVQPR